MLIKPVHHGAKLALSLQAHSTGGHSPMSTRTATLVGGLTALTAATVVAGLTASLFYYGFCFYWLLEMFLPLPPFLTRTVDWCFNLVKFVGR